MWEEGSITMNDSVFHCWMKQYEEGSPFGIEGGRISKLMIKHNDVIVCNYDRGWDIEPTTDEAKAAYAIILGKYN